MDEALSIDPMSSKYTFVQGVDRTSCPGPPERLQGEPGAGGREARRERIGRLETGARSSTTAMGHTPCHV